MYVKFGWFKNYVPHYLQFQARVVISAEGMREFGSARLRRRAEGPELSGKRCASAGRSVTFGGQSGNDRMEALRYTMTTSGGRSATLTRRTGNSDQRTPTSAHEWILRPS